MMTAAGIIFASAANAGQFNVEAVVTKPYTFGDTDPLSLMVTQDAEQNGTIVISKGTLLDCPVDVSPSSGKAGLNFRCSPTNLVAADGKNSPAIPASGEIEIKSLEARDNDIDALDLSPAVRLSTGSTVNLLLYLEEANQ